jgi:Ca2+-binding RTX toxin-like protein
VQSTVNFSLADTVHAIGTIENLTLLGTGNLTGTGNASDNRIIGNSGNNTLVGGAGDDLVNGGAGNDVISGGTGHDQVFGGAGNDVFTYTDADFGGASGVLGDNSDDFFDYSAGDSFDLTGLVSSADLTLAGGEFSDVIRVVDSGSGVLAVEVNEAAVLHSSADADWSAAFNVYGTDVADLRFTLDGHDWVYNSTTSAFEQAP